MATRMLRIYHVMFKLMQFLCLPVWLVASTPTKILVSQPIIPK